MHALLAGVIAALPSAAILTYLERRRRALWQQRGLDARGRRVDGAKSSFAERNVLSATAWAALGAFLGVAGLLLMITGNQRGAITIPIALLGFGMAFLTRRARPKNQ
jgi:hypothetical protein